MPVVFLTGFNGSMLTHNDYGRPNLFLQNSDPYNQLVVKSSENGVNLMWGNYTANDMLAPRFCVIGRRWGNTTYNGYPSLTMGPSTTDPTAKCIAFYCNFGNPCDWRMGWGMYFAPLGFTADTSFRVGVRVFRNNSLSGTYPLLIGDMTTNAESTSRFTYQWGKGKEVYLEVEWYADSKTLNLYIDDELVQTTGPGFTTYVPTQGISFLSELYNSNNPASVIHSEYKDVYIQRIDSAADIRLGSATKVWPFYPSSDDAVEYLRPAGYNSNAAVAALPMRNDSNTPPMPNPTTAFLSATDIGQSDMYNTNASGIAAKLSTIEAVMLRTYALNPLTGTRQMTVKASLNGVVTESPSSTVPNDVSGFRLKSLIMTSDPNGTRWTPSTVAALKIGTQVKS